MEHIYDVLIVGGGPGGYTTALYAARAGLDTVILEKLSAGGQMALTTQIDNYPGFPDGVDGFTLGQQMQQGAERFGVKTELAQVRAMELRGDIKRVETEQGTYLAKTVVIATGATPAKLGLPDEQALVGRGVGYCAHCDGMFYRGKTVAVVGGGNTAAASALHLSRIAKKVILIHRRDTLRATKLYHAQLKILENLEFCWNSKVTKLLYDDRLSGIMVADVDTEQERHIPCDGIFVSIGSVPATELVKGQLELDAAGYIVADESTRTNIPGVFAVGDVRTKALRQIITAAGDGAVAAHYAEQYLISKEEVK